MKKLLFIIIWQQSYAILCFNNQCPENPKSNTLVNHGIYCLSVNPKTKLADWAAYELNISNFSGKKCTQRTWQADTAITPNNRITPADYIGANRACAYDRGHQVPLADFDIAHGCEYTNYLSNVTPQIATLNRGIWQDLERATRKLTTTTAGAVYVVTGPYYTQQPMCKLPNSIHNIIVPNGYWKVIILPEKNNKCSVVAFSFTQYPYAQHSYCAHIVDIAKLNAQLHFKIIDNERIVPNDKLKKYLGC